MRLMKAIAVTIIGVFLVFTGGCHVSGLQAGEERIGFSEDFDTLDGWKPLKEDDLIESMKVVDGVAVFDTWVGSFMGAKPEDQPVVARATSDVAREYDHVVDLDKYHYIVMKTDEKSMFSILYLNDKELQVAYTSGVIAQDISHLGLTGKQKIKLGIEIMNNNRLFKVDYIRLVSTLTDEERKGLVRPPVKLYHEDVPSHPYQKLQALWDRAARPPRAIEEERVAFHDVGTGVPVWRVTAQPTDEGFSERYRMWMPDGSAWATLTGGRRTWTYSKDRFVRGTIDDLDPPKYKVSAYARRGWFQFFRYNPETKKYDVIYEHERKGKGGSAAVAGDKLVALDKDLVVVDASKTPPQVRHYPVPSVSAKGFGPSVDNKWIQYYSPFGVYRRYCVNLQTGKLVEGAQLTFTHGMGGRPWSIMSYGSVAKLQVNQFANYPDMKQPGDKLRVHGVYLDPVSTDYGAMTLDGRYGYTNGIRGELAGQYVMFDREDPGTILRLCNYRVSKIDWYVWTKSITSPDYTKMGYVSDILGNSDYFMCIVRKPDAPKDLKAQRVGADVKLSWKAPERRKELKGYNVYRSLTSGRGFTRLNRDLVTKTGFLDARAPDTAFYLVAAEEHSGLEGYFSDEAGVGEVKRIARHYECEEHRTSRPMRLVVDGDASGGYAVRVTPVAAGENTGSVTIPVDVPREALCRVWVRYRSRSTEGGLRIKTSSSGFSSQGGLKTAEWTWLNPGRLKIRPGDALTVESASDGFCVDKIILAANADFEPKGTAPRVATPPAVKGLKVVETKPNEIAIAWEKLDIPGLSHYSVYVDDKPDFDLSNETVLVSTRGTQAADWGIKPGTTYYYTVVAFDKRGNASKPVTIEAKTKPLNVVVRELPATGAKLTNGLKRGKAVRLDVNYVEFPKGAADVEQKLTFEADVPADGDYYVWMEYSPRHARARRIFMDVDGKEWGGFTTEQPSRLKRSPEIKPGKERWFVERFVAGGNATTRLSAGKHTLDVKFDPKLAGQQPWVSKLWITNDASYMPPGFYPQFRFNRHRRQKSRGLVP